jgi:glucose-1-phosphate adenylyltransferase
MNSLVPRPFDDTPPTSVLALVLAGGLGQRLAPLTRAHCKPAVAFGGRYRNIDFALSNAVNSGLRRIAVVSQYESLSLHRHLESAWAALPRRLGEFVELWPAQQRRRQDWYSGTADAVRQNLDRIEALGARRLVVLAGDHVYRMDYRQLLTAHAAHGGAVTVAASAVRARDADRYGVLDVGPGGRVIRFDEKPAGLAAVIGPEAAVLVSMGIYVIEVDWLREQLLRELSWVDFGHDLMPAAMRAGELHAFAHVDANGRSAYWRDVGTLPEYWRAHLDLLGPRPVFALHDPEWPLWTAACDLGPACLTSGTGGEPVDVADAILADGVRIEGAYVHGCVIGVGASVGPRARLDRVVVLPGARVPAGARIHDAIVDEDGTVHAMSEPSRLDARSSGAKLGSAQCEAPFPSDVSDDAA